MIKLERATGAQLAWARAKVTTRHYLRSWPHSRGSLYPYAVRLLLPTGQSPLVGVLVFGRPEATRLYDEQSALTYGSLDDVRSGKAQYTRWEILNLARVWLRPSVQLGGRLHCAELLPGFTDRRGVFRSTMASAVIELALDRIVIDYLAERPPVWVEEPYQLREVISYCDTRIHKGTIYRAAGFRNVFTNEEGVETWARTVRPLTVDEDALVCRRAAQSRRSIEKRAERRVKDRVLQGQLFDQEVLS